MRKLKSFFCKSDSKKTFNKVELGDFIETALISIIQGVEHARSKLTKSQSEILPIMGPAFSGKFDARLNHSDGFYYQEIEFDLAVTVENKISASISVELKTPIISVIGANLSGDYEYKNSTVSHIKFHVPIGLSVKDDLKK